MADAMPPEKKRRAPQRKLTDADKSVLIEILKRPDVRVDGKIDIPTIAKLTGFTYAAVYGFISSDRFLHAQLAEVDSGKLIPAESDLIDSNPPADPPTGITISNAQFEEYRSMIRQQRKMMAADWAKLGMTEEAGKRMEHYGNLGTAPTSMILRATTGQLISNLELLDQIVKADCERILTGRLPKEEDGKGVLRDPNLVEREWRHTVYSGMKLQLDMFSHVHKVQALMARVMADLIKLNGGSKPQEKGTYEAGAPVSERSS